MEVFKHNNIILKNISFSSPEKTQKIYYSSISYKDDKPLYIQSNKLKFIKIIEESNQKFLIVEMPKKDFSVYDMLISMDDTILSSTHENSEEWFKKQIPFDIFEHQYKRITKPFNKDEIPTLKLKLPYSKNKYLFSIYDNSNSVIDIDKLIKNTDIICVFHIKGIKFLKEYFYCDCYITQIKLCQNLQYNIPDSCIINDEGDINNDDILDIIDSDIIKRAKEKAELQEQINELEKKISSDNSNMLTLKSKLNNLVNNF